MIVDRWNNLEVTDSDEHIIKVKDIRKILKSAYLNIKTNNMDESMIVAKTVSFISQELGI